MAAVGRKVKLALLALLLFGAAVSAVQGLRNGMECVDFHWESAALFLRGRIPIGIFWRDACTRASVSMRRKLRQPSPSSCRSDSWTRFRRIGYGRFATFFLRRRSLS